MVEMAVLAPVLVLLIFGLIEMSYLLFAWVTVQEAAQAGVRFAITGQGEQAGTRLTQIQNTATNAIKGISPSSVTVYVRSWNGQTASGAATENNAGQPCTLVEVEVQHTHQFIVPFIARFLKGPVILHGKQRSLNEPWAWASCQ